MVKHAAVIPVLPVRIDPASAAPIWRQLYDGLREAILCRQLGPGSRLPATRVLATGLGVSRQTVVGAYEQLVAEGYLEARVGSGTQVARELPETLLQSRATAQGRAPTATGRRLSRRGALLATIPVEAVPDVGPPRPFRAGVPALDAFPHTVWSRLAARRQRSPSAALLGYADARGYPPLRAAIASQLATARGIACRPEQVIVVAGTQAALDLAARVLLDPGDRVWVEDPGYLGGRGALRPVGRPSSPCRSTPPVSTFRRPRRGRPTRGWPTSRRRTSSRSA